MWGLIIGLSIQLFAAGMEVAFMQKPSKPTPGTLNDFKYPQIEEGTLAAIIFGDLWLDTWFVLFYGNMRLKDIKSSGSKK